MSKQSGFTIKGKVVDVLPNALFKIKLETGQEILGHLAGKLRMHKIHIIEGDGVDIEMSPYDLTRGRITHRYKE